MKAEPHKTPRDVQNVIDSMERAQQQPAGKRSQFGAALFWFALASGVVVQFVLALVGANTIFRTLA